MERDLELWRMVKEGESPPVLRLYAWSPPAVSLGRHQVRERVVDERECRSMGVDVVRRPTGGRAVLHWDELTYSMVLPDSYPGLPRGVVDSYRWLSRVLVRALQDLGIEAAMAAPEGRGSGTAPGSCFDTASPHEVQIEGKKVIGSAQLRRRGVLLQHGSIALRFPARASRLLLPESGENRGTEKLVAHAAGLYDLGYLVTVPEIAQALCQGLETVLEASVEVRSTANPFAVPGV